MEELGFGYSMQDGQTQSKNCLNCQGERICLATGDLHCISVDKVRGNVQLREKKLSDKACVFRKKVLETKSTANGRVETVAFALDCYQDFYLSTSSQGHMELKFQTTIPRVQKPDERSFTVYVTKVGHMLIQPTLHSDMYLHHKDQVLSVQQLDLNESRPEKYFFYFDAIPKKQICQDIPVVTCNTCAVFDLDTSVTLDTVGNSVKQEKQVSSITKLPFRKSAKTKTPLSVLFYGCFSNIGKKVSQSK